MNELIAVTYKDDQPMFSGRELHAFLAVPTQYKDWFPRMCEYGFLEGVDFSSFLSESTGGRPAQDHQLTIDMAKELCMLQRTEKGKQVRQYFIQLEKAWNTPEQVMARALRLADRKMEEIKRTVFTLESIIEAQRPKVLFADAVETSQTSINVGVLAKLLNQNGIDIGQNRLFSCSDSSREQRPGLLNGR